MNSPKRFTIILIIAFCLTFFGWYISAKQKKESADVQKKSDKNYKDLSDKFDKQTIALSDNRHLTAQILSLMRGSNRPESSPSIAISSKQEVINKLSYFVSIGGKIQVDGTKTDLSIDDYKNEREKWLSEIRDFLLTDKTIQANPKWKYWAGGNGCDDSFECRDDGTEFDYPVGCPEDRKEYFRDNSRRINNLTHFITEASI